MTFYESIKRCTKKITKVTKECFDKARFFFVPFVVTHLPRAFRRIDF